MLGHNVVEAEAVAECVSEETQRLVGTFPGLFHVRIVMNTRRAPRLSRTESGPSAPITTATVCSARW